MILDGALQIQRLEGSRPHGSLCTLNRPERVPRDLGWTELCKFRWPEGRTSRLASSPRADEASGEAGSRGLLAG